MGLCKFVQNILTIISRSGKLTDLKLGGVLIFVPRARPWPWP